LKEYTQTEIEGKLKLRTNKKQPDWQVNDVMRYLKLSQQSVQTYTRPDKAGVRKLRGYIYVKVDGRWDWYEKLTGGFAPADVWYDSDFIVKWAKNNPIVTTSPGTITEEDRELIRSFINDPARNLKKEDGRVEIYQVIKQLKEAGYKGWYNNGAVYSKIRAILNEEDVPVPVNARKRVGKRRNFHKKKAS
jgi:hypothetical protein